MDTLTVFCVDMTNFESARIAGCNAPASSVEINVVPEGWEDAKAAAWSGDCAVKLAGPIILLN